MILLVMTMLTQVAFFGLKFAFGTQLRVCTCLKITFDLYSTCKLHRVYISLKHSSLGMEYLHTAARAIKLGSCAVPLLCVVIVILTPRVVSFNLTIS